MLIGLPQESALAFPFLPSFLPSQSPVFCLFWPSDYLGRRLNKWLPSNVKLHFPGLLKKAFTGTPTKCSLLSPPRKTGPKEYRTEIAKGQGLPGTDSPKVINRPKEKYPLPLSGGRLYV